MPPSEACYPCRTSEDNNATGKARHRPAIDRGNPPLAAGPEPRQRGRCAVALADALLAYRFHAVRWEYSCMSEPGMIVSNNVWEIGG